MQRQWIDDHYDARKRAVLSGLIQRGLLRRLAVIPMATDSAAWTSEDCNRYLTSLGVREASVATATPFRRSRSGNPGSYFTGLDLPLDVDLFLDPDSGLTERNPGDKWQRWNEYAHLAVTEVASLVSSGNQRLAIVYDHSVSRTRDPNEARNTAMARVEAFRNLGLSAVSWFWDRVGALDPLILVAVAAESSRISAIRAAAPIQGAENTV